MIVANTGATTGASTTSSTAGAFSSDLATSTPKIWSAMNLASFSSCLTAATTNASLCAGYVTVTTDPSNVYWQAAATGYAFTRAAAT